MWMRFDGAAAPKTEGGTMDGNPAAILHTAEVLIKARRVDLIGFSLTVQA
jgi:hypothetical protein